MANWKSEIQRPLVLGIAWLFALPVLAQTAVPDPSTELQRQDRQRQELRQRMEVQPWQSSSEASAIPMHQQIPVEQPCSQVDRVVIQGTLFSEDLHASLSGADGKDPPFGRCLGGQGVTILLQRVQEAIVAQGYITSHVHVPAQDLKAGTLLIQINEGRVARIRSSTDVPLPRLAWAMEEGSILNLRDIEQSSENLQRLPSLSSKIQIEPGRAPGTSDLVVGLQAGRPLRLGLSLDDSGNRTTGKLQGSATLTWDNPLGLADFFYITQGQDVGEKDSGPRGSRSQIVHYSVPWGYWLAGATWSDNKYQQTVYGPYESYLYSGTSNQMELSLARVLHRDGQSKTTASIKGFLRESNNFIADLEVLVQRRRTAGWEAGLQHLQHLQSGTLTAQLAYRQGTGAFKALAAPEEEAGQGTGHMRLMTGLLRWVMPLNVDGNLWQYSTQLQWQLAETRLTPQDRFCLGSRGTVRGFEDQQTLCGDQGQLWRQEVAAGLPAAIAFADGVRAYVALDVGNTSTPDQSDRYSMSGMALGLRGQHKLQGAYPLQWDIFLGIPLAHTEIHIADRHTAGMSLRAEF